MKKLVFFDLDGTILGGLSSENAFIFHLLKRGYLGPRRLLSAFGFCFRFASRFKWHVFVKDKAYLLGMSTEKLDQLAKAFVEKRLLKKIRPKMIECIEKHRKAGDHLILLTGSLEALANVFGKHLRMDDVIATKCAQKNGEIISEPPLQHPFSEQKLILAKRECEKYGVPLSKCIAYGNSFNDRILLREVGQPVAVTPSPALKRIATQQNWEILG